MRTSAGQGKLGAVEVKDLSKQMAGLAAQTSMFGTDATTAMASPARSRRSHGSAVGANPQRRLTSTVVRQHLNKGRTADAFKSMGTEY